MSFYEHYTADQMHDLRIRLNVIEKALQAYFKDTSTPKAKHYIALANTAREEIDTKSPSCPNNLLIWAMTQDANLPSLQSQESARLNLMVFIYATFWRISYEEESNLDSLRAAICHNIKFEECSLGRVLADMEFLRLSKEEAEMATNGAEICCILHHANYVDRTLCCSKNQANAYLRKRANDWMIQKMPYFKGLSPLFEGSDIDKLFRTFPEKRLHEPENAPKHTLSLDEIKYYKDSKWFTIVFQRMFAERVTAKADSKNDAKSYRYFFAFLSLLSLASLENEKAPLFPDEELAKFVNRESLF